MYFLYLCYVYLGLLLQVSRLHSLVSWVSFVFLIIYYGMSWFLFLLFFLQQNETKKASHKGNRHGDLQCRAATRCVLGWQWIETTHWGLTSSWHRFNLPDWSFTCTVWIRTVRNFVFCSAELRVASPTRGALTNCIWSRTHLGVTVACLWTFFGNWDAFHAHNIIT